LRFSFFPLKSAEPNEDPKHIPESLRRAVERMRIYHHLPLRISELSALVGMSPSHFIRTFKKVMGKSPIDWVRHERIHHAQRRLAESEDSMKQIARQVGYNDQFYFSRDFKNLVGVTPTDYRNREKLKR
jgi:AraC-like DNA-binding protein